MKKLLKLALINFAIIIIIFPILSFSQCVSGTISYPPPAAGINYESKNGFFCPTRGTFRSLIIYAEADYTSGSDPNPTNSDWPIHSFPVWAHNVLDVVQGSMTGELTKYYYQASSGQLNLLGDVLINSNDPSHIFKVPMSATEAADGDPHYDMLFPYINSVTGGVFATANGLSINDFDLWSATFSGSVKSFPSVETPHKFDCVYIVWRNRPVF